MHKAYAVTQDGATSGVRLELPRPLGCVASGPAGPREAAAGVEPLRTLVVLVGPEDDPRAAAPPSLGEHLVEQATADPFAPALGQHVKEIQEGASRYGRAGSTDPTQGGDQGHSHGRLALVGDK